ncbi:MAG: TPM domain-containing protein [Treponema sp.]|nr:TPM domain-containing protein [Candidatus Treponema equi]
MARKNNSFAGILILMFFMIGIPSFLIKQFTHEAEPKARTHSQIQGRVAGGTSEFITPVMDNAGVLSRNGLEQLNQELVSLNQKTGIQIAVLIVKDMDGEDIESFSLRHAEQWKLGQKGVDNGALLVVAMKEHGVRIETGYGAEGVLTDAKCSRILRNVIVPQFKKGNYEKGIIDGTHGMIAVLTGDESMVTSTGTEEAPVKGQSRGGVPVPVMFFIVIWVMMCILGMTGGRRRRGSNLLFWTLLGMNHGHHHDHWGSSGSFGGGSSGGGFGGFSGGGGGFGGGGSSSSW